MRRKTNLDSRIEKCSELMETSAQDIRGAWAKKYPGFKELRLEIGCGKGTFTVETAKREPDILMVALEKEQNAMVMAMEKVQSAGLNNVIFIDGDAAKLSEMFAPGEISMIYLNFSDPWPKSRDAKFRLTAPAFLRSYSDVLPMDGEIRFKTDNTPLFEWSCDMLSSEGWQLRELTNDLHANGPAGVMTDYELRFYAEGKKINRVIAVKSENTKGSAAGAPPRLRNAALSDARGRAEKTDD
ncbi:MAG: tRNA (guanosine(46)-N7)-methyltransferase TrmB [Eubacteriales bacterium]|nr:tRNA (guanosine(46)-N7)-methyltransferase TrmB [Eubacteriales bacterium]